MGKRGGVEKGKKGKDGNGKLGKTSNGKIDILKLEKGEGGRMREMGRGKMRKGKGKMGTGEREVFYLSALCTNDMQLLSSEADRFSEGAPKRYPLCCDVQRMRIRFSSEIRGTQKTFFGYVFNPTHCCSVMFSTFEPREDLLKSWLGPGRTVRMSCAAYGLGAASSYATKALGGIRIWWGFMSKKHF